MNDPLDDLLGPPAIAPDEGLKRDLLVRTTGALLWRRRARMLGGVGVCAAACAAGLLVVLTTTPPEEPIVPTTAVATKEPTPVEPVTPVTLEWRALEYPDAAARLYREAADGYLREGDTTNAMRCYANALDEGGAEALQVNTTDTWLFMAIKQAREKERE